jgi:hypothetical protein
MTYWDKLKEKIMKNMEQADQGPSFMLVISLVRTGTYSYSEFDEFEF